MLCLPLNVGEPDHRRHRAVVPRGADDRRRRARVPRDPRRQLRPGGRADRGPGGRGRRAPSGWPSSRTPPRSCPAASTTARPSRRWRPWWSRRSRTGAPSTSSRTTACTASRSPTSTRRRSSWPGPWRSATPADPDAPRGAWHVLRTGQSELIPEITDEMLVAGARRRGAHADRPRPPAAQCHHRAADRPRAGARRDDVGGRRVRAALHRGRPRASPRTWPGGPPSPSTTPSCTARRSRPPYACSRRCCPTPCRTSPAGTWPATTTPRDAPTSAATSTTRSASVDGRLVLFVGDVMGRGVEARRGDGADAGRGPGLHRRRPGRPRSVLGKLDRMFAQFPTDQLVTLVYLVVDPARDEILVANAGHPPPVLLRADGSTVQLPDADGCPLGVLVQDRIAQAPCRCGTATRCCCSPTASSSAGTRTSTSARRQVLHALPTLAHADLDAALVELVVSLREPSLRRRRGRGGRATYPLTAAPSSTLAAGAQLVDADVPRAACRERLADVVLLEELRHGVVAARDLGSGAGRPDRAPPWSPLFVVRREQPLFCRPAASPRPTPRPSPRLFPLGHTGGTPSEEVPHAATRVLDRGAPAAGRLHVAPSSSRSPSGTSSSSSTALRLQHAVRLGHVVRPERRDGRHAPRLR